MTPEEVLALHRDLVQIPSVSHEERAIVDFLARYLVNRGLDVNRIGENLLVEVGSGPTLCFNSHLDTVPPTDGWTHDPWKAKRDAGRVYGLGSNDAKASVAAMISAFVALEPTASTLGITLMLALVVEEETGGDGAELVAKAFAESRRPPNAIVIGEPTGLDAVIAQKGLLILDLVAKGTPCHAAHAKARGVHNPIRTLAADLTAIDGVDLGPDDALLGPTTLEPTVLSGGKAHNSVPAEARCVLDLRTNPIPTPPVLTERLRKAVRGEVRIRSDRFRPCATPAEHPLLDATRDAKPDCRFVGSRTLSDWVYFSDIPAIKIGPGATERSHTADEFVYEAEVIEGATFYEKLALAYSRLAILAG